MDTPNVAIWGRWSLGVALALLNCVLSSMGFTLQRLSHVEEMKKPEEQQRPPSARPAWIIGVSMYMMAALPDVFAYALAPQIVCSTVACARLVMVTLFAHIILDEKIHSQEMGGMLLCTLGTAACLYFGPLPSERSHLRPEEMLSPKVLTYLLLAGSLLAVLTVIEHKDAVRSLLPKMGQDFLLPFLVALAFCLEKVFNTEVGNVSHVQDLWEQPKWALMLLFIAGLGLCDFYFNLRGVKHMPVQVFVPISFAFNTVLQYFQGLVILDEFENMKHWRISACMCGALCALVGAICIQPPRLCLVDKQLLAVEVNEEPSLQACKDVGHI